MHSKSVGIVAKITATHHAQQVSANCVHRPGVAAVAPCLSLLFRNCP